MSRFESFSLVPLLSIEMRGNYLDSMNMEFSCKPDGEHLVGGQDKDSNIETLRFY